jgi:type I restriction enzyme, S subunit
MSLSDSLEQGVPVKTLGEVGVFVRGNGMLKSDLLDSGVPAIHYGQVHTIYGTATSETTSYVSPELAARLRKAQPGDLVIATTAEDDDSVAKAVAWIGDIDVVVSGDAYIYRHSLDPVYAAIFFQSAFFHAQKRRYVNGTKVRRISGDNLAKINIPVPAMAVQREIANRVSTLERLENELASVLRSEVECRARQYAFHRQTLLSFDTAEDVLWRPLAEVAAIGTGSRNTNEAVADGHFPFFVRSQEPLKLDTYEFDEAAIITAGDGVGVGKVFHFVDGKYALHQRAYRIAVTSPDLLPKFLFYFMRNGFAGYLAMTSVHASVTSLRKPMFEKYLVPIPPLPEQERVVVILDKLEALVTELSENLPAELKARRKQYQFCRDRMFKVQVAAE